MVTEEDYARVAAISANDDDAVGAVIAKALHTVGDGGIVTVEESAANGMSVDFVEGFEFDNGYLSPYMVTNPASLEAIVDDPYILLCSEKITKVQQLMPILDKIMRAPRPLVIIAETVEGTALQMLVHNHVNGIFQCVAVRAPGFGDRRLHKLEDIAAITGGAVYSRHSGFTLETMTIDQLGRAARSGSTRTGPPSSAAPAPPRRSSSGSPSCAPSGSGPRSGSTRTCSPSGSARCPARSR